MNCDDNNIDVSNNTIADGDEKKVLPPQEPLQNRVLASKEIKDASMHVYEKHMRLCHYANYLKSMEYLVYCNVKELCINVFFRYGAHQHFVDLFNSPLPAWIGGLSIYANDIGSAVDCLKLITHASECPDKIAMAISELFSPDKEEAALSKWETLCAPLDDLFRLFSVCDGDDMANIFADFIVLVYADDLKNFEKDMTLDAKRDFAAPLSVFIVFAVWSNYNFLLDGLNGFRKKVETKKVRFTPPKEILNLITQAFCDFMKRFKKQMPPHIPVSNSNNNTFIYDKVIVTKILEFFLKSRPLLNAYII